MSVQLRIVPVTQRDAIDFIRRHHRHNKPPQGDVIRAGLQRDDHLVGVATAGRPVARMLDDGMTLEVTRCCVIEGNKNGCSMLYSALRRAAKALGWRRMFTYTLGSEVGASLKASGWLEDSHVRPQAGWARTERDRQPLFTDETAKTRWVMDLFA